VHAEHIAGRFVNAAIGRRRASRCWWRGSRPLHRTLSSSRNTAFLTSMSSNTPR
jgi:hypothetical protein